MSLPIIVAELQARRLEVEGELRDLDAALAILTGLSGKAHGRIRHRRKHMSLAARERISEAQKARWATFRAEKKRKRIETARSE